MEQQYVMKDDHTSMASVTSFPSRAFERGTSQYEVFLETLLECWLTFERTQGVLADASTRRTLPAA